ncbi:hypothetical protein HY008_00425 [Candidatus Woesebacteria bacterium]|nr:hypothetical protein [Candidatus Woesebacteria bacterium]
MRLEVVGPKEGTAKVYQFGNLIVFSPLDSQVEKLKNDYLGNKTATLFNALKQAVEKSDLSKVGAVAVTNNVVHCAAKGGVSISLRRGQLSAKILESGQEVVSASGYPKEGDVLVLKANESGGEIEIKFEVEPKLREVKFTKILDFLIKILPERKIAVRGEDEIAVTRKRKVAILVGVILLILLGISVLFGIKKRNERLTRGRYESKLSEAQHDLGEAIALSALNPTRSRELFKVARSLSVELENEDVKDPAFETLKRQISEISGRILGEYNVETDLFLDLTLLSSGFKGDEVVVSEGKMYILDRQGARLVAIAIATKKSEVVAGPDQVSEATKVASYSGRSFIVTDKGVFELISGKTSLVIEKDWFDEVWPRMYAGNMYLLELKGGNIWRFSGIEVAGKSGFGSKQRWLGSGISVDLSGAVSWAIDGSIWILTSEGKIMKFTLGAPKSFSLGLVEPSLSNPVDLYTDEEQSSLYFLDSANSRVVVFDKNGEFKAQYISDKIGEAKQLVISEKDKRVVLLAGEKLYSIELKHLEQ